MALTWIVAYDIGDDRRRYRAAQVLLGYGSRIQYSVYECRLLATDVDVMLERVRNTVDPLADLVHAFPLCQSCSAASRTLGSRAARPAALYYIL
jgi:CRISPR-associated protein Cas2